MVDMAIQGSNKLDMESMERAKFSRDHPPGKATLEVLDAHKRDLIRVEDEDPIGIELAKGEEIPGIEACKAPVAVRELSIKEKMLPRPLEEHQDGQESTGRLEAFQ
jgi:hypothetical protein